MRWKANEHRIIECKVIQHKTKEEFNAKYVDAFQYTRLFSSFAVAPYQGKAILQVEDKFQVEMVACRCHHVDIVGKPLCMTST